MSDFRPANSIDEIEPGQQDIVRQRERAENIVLLARKKGEQIIVRANENARQIEKSAKEEGYQKGYEEGLERGYIKGQEQFSNRTEAILNQLLEAQAEYEKHIDILLDNLEPRILDMILTALHSVLKQKIAKDDELVIRTLRNAMKNLTQRDKILLTVNREEVEKITSRSEELVSSSDLIVNMEVVPGEKVGKGGVVVSSPEGIVDARIESQLEVVNDIVSR
jgi:flagellar assembly protein FliH